MNLGEDTIQPVTVTNFRFLQTNFMWVRFLGCCFVGGFGGGVLVVTKVMPRLQKKLLQYSLHGNGKGERLLSACRWGFRDSFTFTSNTTSSLSVSLNAATSYLPSFLSYTFLSVKWVE